MRLLTATFVNTTLPAAMGWGRGIAVVAVVAVVGAGALWLWSSGNQTGETSLFGTRLREESGSEGAGGRQPLAARPRGKEGAAAERAALPGEAARAGEEGRSRLAEARSIGGGGAQVVGEAVGSSESGGSVEVNVPAEEGRERVAQLKPQRPVQQEVVETGTAQQEANLEPPPEIVFEGGKEQKFVTESQVELTDAGRISGEAGSVALWVKPDWQPDDQNDATFVQLGEKGIRMAKNVNFLRFEFVDDQGIERGAGVPLDAWQPGEWHHVTGVWVGGRLQLYVDGKLVSQNQFDSAPNFGEQPKVLVGSNLPSPAPGEMTDVRILNRVLQASEIEELARAANRPQ